MSAQPEPLVDDDAEPAQHRARPTAAGPRPRGTRTATAWSRP